MRLPQLHLLVLLTPLVAGSLGCGMLAPKGGAGAGASSGGGGGAAYDSPQASKDMVRTQEAKSDAMIDPIEDQEVAKQEKDVLHALAMSLGKEGPAPGMPPYESGSQALTELRAAKFKLRIEPVTNSSGAAIGGGSFVQLKDSFSDRVQALQGKLAAGTASASERAEVMSGSKQIMKLQGLKMQVNAISLAALGTNTHVLNGSLTAMLKISGMVAVRKQQNMDWTDDDYARVKRILTRQKHWEAMGAATMGMMAAYEAIIGTNTGDPKALDAIADSTTKAFPLNPQVSDDDAKSYVSHLTDNVAAMKSKYETMMRGAVGDAMYEQQYKAGIDRMFAQAGNAGSTKSVTQVAADTNSKYQADLAKCARGEPLDPGFDGGAGEVPGGSRAGAGRWWGRRRRISGGRSWQWRRRRWSEPHPWQRPERHQQGPAGHRRRGRHRQRRRRGRAAGRGRHVPRRRPDPELASGRRGAHEGRLQGRAQVRARTREPHPGWKSHQGRAGRGRQAARPVRLSVARLNGARRSGAPTAMVRRGRPSPREGRGHRPRQPRVARRWARAA